MDQPSNNVQGGGVAARAVALDLLGAVAKGVTLDEALAGHQGLKSLESRDRDFVRMLTATILRRLGQIDALIGHFVERPLPTSARKIHDILRLGICQMMVLETAPHAVVDTAVQLAETRGHVRYKGLVNAVLRRISREGAALFAAQDAARLNTPDWLWQSWTDAYGAGTCRAIALANLAEAPLDITVKSDAPRWASELDAEILPTGALRRKTGGGLVTELPGFAEGAWWVQDAAAQLPARVLLSGLGADAANAAVCDLCAAPGGKTAQLAAAGARVTAIDWAEGRLALIRENLKRLGLEAKLIAADVTKWQPAEAPAAVLLDAPCTATGTIRRHPDIPRAKGPQDVKRLVPIQDRLLAAAAKMIHKGGILVYSVCSLEPDEGPARIAQLLRSEPGMTRLPVSMDEIGGMGELIAGEGDICTLPSQLAGLGGMDGFYIARLGRNG